MSANDQAASVGKASAGKLAILYDGSCEMCRASLDGIRQFDNSGKMEPLDLHHEDVRAQFPELKLENLLEELHAVDENGRVYRGARAITKFCGGRTGSRATSRTCGTSRATRGWRIGSTSESRPRVISANAGGRMKGQGAGSRAVGRRRCRHTA